MRDTGYGMKIWDSGDATHVGVVIPFATRPRVAPGPFVPQGVVAPWAGGRNPVGILVIELRRVLSEDLIDEETEGGQGARHVIDGFRKPSFLFVDPVVFRFNADLKLLALQAFARQSFSDAQG